jgi:hypothetical protein
LSLCVAIKPGTKSLLSAISPVPRHNYRFGINQPGRWREELNTDSMHYHGSNTGNGGGVHSDEIVNGRAHSLSVTIPPLATVWFVREMTNDRRQRDATGAHEENGVNFTLFSHGASGVHF